MAVVYDEETLLVNIETILKNNLNTKIASINTEKNDSITLASVDTTYGYFYDMDDRSANINPFILSMISDIASEGIGPTTSRQVTINVALVLCDDGNDFDIVKRMLRYGRAIREVIEENFYSIKFVDLLKVEGLPIMGFQKSGKSLKYKIIGINIISSIA